MIVVGDGVEDDNTYISLAVSNVGDAPTTINNVVLHAYCNRFARMLRRTEVKAAIVNHSLAQSIPYTLPAGGQFMSRVIQEPDIEQ